MVITLEAKEDLSFLGLEQFLVISGCSLCSYITVWPSKMLFFKERHDAP